MRLQMEQLQLEKRREDVERAAQQAELQRVQRLLEQAQSSNAAATVTSDIVRSVREGVAAACSCRPWGTPPSTHLGKA